MTTEQRKSTESLAIEEVVEQQDTVERITVRPKGTETTPDASSKSSTNGEARVHGEPEYVGAEEPTVQEIEQRKGGRFAFLRTKEFWIVLALSYVSILIPCLEIYRS